jgi:Secretion system C-terminal sorting domain
MKKIFLIYCLLCAIVEKCVAQVPTQQPYPATPTIANVAEVEAYVGNTDPGVGNGTPITIPTGVTNATATNVTLNFTAQPNGVQFLYIRSRDVFGRWSLTNYKLFTVGNFNYPTAPTVANVAEVEAYVGNTDPGVGNGSPITIPAGAIDATVTNATLNFTAQPNGVQFVYVRSRDVFGRWSLTNYKQLVVGNFNYPTAPAVANVAELEYYVGNTDPGNGNGTNITIPTGTTDATATNTTITLPVLPDGIQTLYLRSRDVFGRWSLTNYKQFITGLYNYPTAPPLGNVAEVEAYVGNTDPGVGNGTPITIPTGVTDATATNATLNFTAQPNGSQFVYVRSRDQFGKWSQTNYKLFIVGNFTYPTAPPLANIAELEYYVGNNDPGVGNGTNITIPIGVPDASAVNTNITFPAQANGVQYLYLRSRDQFGKWSQTNYKQLLVGQLNYATPPNALPTIGNLEYYVDNDPGFGNATPITVSGTLTDVQLSNISITLSNTLTSGTHVFHIRSKQNPWSIDNAVTFNVGTVTPVNWLYVKAQLQNNSSFVNWATATETNTKNFDVEWGTNGINFTKLGEVAAAGNSNVVSHYNYKHTTPSNGFNYYRVKQIDLNGEAKYSTIVKVLYNKNIKQTIVAPNPVADMLNVIEPKAVFITAITIIDSKGATVVQKSINAEEQVLSIQVSQLAKGQYVIKVQYKNEAKSYSFMKN